MKQDDTSRQTIGMDLGDRYAHVCVLDDEGEVVEECRVAQTARGLRGYLGGREPAVIAIEASTHSPWVSRMTTELGHEVLVANPRRTRAIWDRHDKNDRTDAEMLARLARFEPKLLYPIQHRGAEAQLVRSALRAREALVRVRTTLINTVRSLVKGVGSRLPKKTSASFHTLRDQLPGEVGPVLLPLMDELESLTTRIRGYDRTLREAAQELFSEVERLEQVDGVGPITALAFVSTLEEPTRFARSRKVPAYLGLTPRQDQSGGLTKQCRISKRGDELVRRLLVQCAQYILGPFGKDCALRRWGLRLAERGGKAGKRRATVAVARKLAVLLHRLWLTGDDYEPMRGVSVPA